MRCQFDGLARLMVLSALLLLFACGAQLTAEERIDLARTQLAQGDAPTAIIHLRNVLQEDPSNVQARVLLAEASFKAADYDSAAKEYLRAIELGAEVDELRLPLVESLVRAGGTEEALRYSDPERAGDAPELRYWRALALGRSGRAEEARTLLLSLDAPPAVRDRAQVGLARIALTERKPAEVLAILAPLAGTMAGDADYWEVKAFASLQAGNAEDAVEAFREGARVVVDPLGGQSFMFRAGETEALLAAGRIDEARTVARALHAQAERNPVANYLMSRVELQSGNADQALAHAQAVLAAQPDSSVGHMMAGAASLALGQTGPAERHLERAIASEPGNLPARKLLAQARLGLQSPQRALEALGPAIGESGDTSMIQLAGLASVLAGNPEGAVGMLREQLARDPGDDETRAMLANTLMSMGRTEEALAELGQIKAAEGAIRQRADLIAVALHLQGDDPAEARSLAARMAAGQPGDVPLRNALGALFQSVGLADEAAAWYEESLALDPADAAAAYNLGIVSAGRGELDRAGELFQGILAREPDNALALSALAQVDWAQDRRELALERLERARQTNPADSNARFVLTQYLVALGRAADAVPVAREAVTLLPGLAPVVNALGVALLESGAAGEALPQFLRASEIDPAGPIYLLNRARAHAVLGEPERAREQLINALALDPDNVGMLALLVDVERRTGSLEAAAQALARLEGAAPPGDPGVVMVRGDLLLSQQRYLEAEQAFSEAQRLGVGNRAVIGVFEARRRGGLPEPAATLLAWLAEHPDDGAVRAVLADHHIATGDQVAAIREYERLIELAPDNPVFLNNLAWLYGEAGDERALGMARRAHEFVPANPLIADTYGWLLHKRGDHAAALELLAGAVAAAPEASDVRYRYAEVLAATGDPEGAIREARIVLADTGAANYHEPAQKLVNRLERGGE